MATYHPSQKLSKLDEPDRQDTAGEVRMNSSAIYSCGPYHMDELSTDKGCSLEDLPGVMDNRDE